MKKQIHCIIASLAVLIIVSACKGKENEADHGKIESPPSLQNKESVTQKVVLTEKQSEQLAIKTTVIRKSLAGYPLIAPGMALPSPENLYIVSAPIEGRVATVFVREGEYVNKGQLLAELESLMFTNMVADYLQAKAEEEYQQNQWNRIKLLSEKGISSSSSLEKANADFVRAQSVTRSVRSRLNALGISEKQLEAWRDSSCANTRIHIYAPISGYVSERLIDLGQPVSAYQKMMTIVNLNWVLIKGYLSPEDAWQVNVGDTVITTMKDFPDRQIVSRIETINPSLDPINRSVAIHFHISTRDRWPKPGQNVRLIIRARTTEPVIVVPLSAVIFEGQSPQVFVQTGDRIFERRTITLRRLTDQSAIVEQGLNEGEKVAISQVFNLKALARFEEFAE